MFRHALAGDVVEVTLLEQDGVVLERLPAALLEDRHEPVAVEGLDNERRAWAQDPQELRKGLTIALLPPVADRREKAEHGVETLVLERQLAEVGL